MPKITTTYQIVPVTSYEVVVTEEIEHEDGTTSGSIETFGLYSTEARAQTAVNALKKLDEAGIPNG